MNEQSTGQTNVSMQDNLSLTDGENEVMNSRKISTFFANIRNTKDKLRRFFIKKNEKSVIVTLLEKLYYTLLSLKSKIPGVFLLSFGITSMAMTTLISPTFGSFISSESTLYAFIIILIGLLLSATNKTVEELINGSIIISPLNIVYSQQGIISSYKTSGMYNEYSSAVFIGIILGIFSIIFPSTAILGFLLSLLYALFIFNRPECGILMIVLFLPFLREFYVIVFSVITLLALFYKYFLGKRHIDISFVEILSIIFVLYIVIRFLSVENFVAAEFLEAFTYILFFLVFISASSLVRSTSMYRRSLLIIINFTRIFTLILVLNYIFSVILGFNVSGFLVSAGLPGLEAAISHEGFVIPFIAMAIPLNLSYILSTGKSSATFKGVLYIILMLCFVIILESKMLLAVALVSSIIILTFKKKRCLFLLVIVPVSLYTYNKLALLIPDKYRMSFIGAEGYGWDSFNNIMKTNAAFGSGFSRSDTVINNTALKILGDVGIFGSIVFASIIICALAVTIRSLLKNAPFISKVKFFTIGQIVASLSFAAICMSMNSTADMRMIFLFSVIFSLAYSSVRCYEADYIDEFTVREYLN